MDGVLSSIGFLGRLILGLFAVAGLAYLAGLLVRWYQDR